MRVELSAIANFVVDARGWRRAIIALLAGALSALSMPPFGLFPLLFLTFPVLVWLTDAAGTGRRGIMAAAVSGWWFGFGYHLAGLWWIGMAFLVEADRFLLAMPFAVVALPAALAFFTAFGLALARTLWTGGPLRILALALGLGLADFARGHMFTGFPWNLFGYALTQAPGLAQSAAFVGVYGMSFLAILVFASPATVWDAQEGSARRFLAPALAALALAGMALFGQQRLAANPVETVAGVRLRIVQPNVPQDQRFSPEARDWVIERYKTLSRTPAVQGPAGVEGITHLVWPESAFPFFLLWEPSAMAEIARLLEPGVTLITGAARPGSASPAQNSKAYNSVYVIGSDGAIKATYDKAHLVPFGEYMPGFIRKLGIDQMIDVPGGFTSAERRRRVAVPGAPDVQPLICYEVIFSGEVDAEEGRAGWIVNVTNDAWFGDTPGPHQHLHQAQVRAIEEGLPIMRAANSGISASIDPLGRIMGALPLMQAGVLDVDLPRPLAPTVFSRFGHAPVMAVWLLLLVCVMVVRHGNNNRSV